MTLRLRTFLALAIALLLSGTVRAQDGSQPPRFTAPSQPAGYTVTGRVVCTDTQRAARFAQVTLIPVQSSAGDGERGRRASARTDLDGRFSMENVPAGDYFATAQSTGYINEGPALQMALSAGGDALNAVTNVPRVQVTTGGAVVQISLERGAVLAGTVQWDDGSPAAGVQVAAQAAPTNGTTTSTPAAPSGNGSFRQGLFNGFAGGGQTDDRGRFRLSGLAPGSYVLRASVQSPLPEAPGGSGRFQRLMTLSVYAPNKLRRTEATVLTLVAGEERADVNVVLGLGGMHTVSGQVSSSSAAVHSGSVLLTDQTDPSLNRRGIINADGSFAIPYVPAGNYSVRVNASAQMPGEGRGTAEGADAGIRFQPLQASVTVADSDLSGVSLNVTPATTASTQ